MRDISSPDGKRRKNDTAPLPTVKWYETKTRKINFLEEVFDRAWCEDLQEEIDRFRRQNGWLDDYLPYRVIQEMEHFASWEKWGPRYKDPETLNQLRFDMKEKSRQPNGRASADRFNFYSWLQLVLHRQFTDFKRYANRRGVLLEGDIPILVARDSADVWRHPSFFFLDRSAGAPPDMYSGEWQNWGFPTYNWNALRAADFSWWRDRLRYAEHFFDLYRIDHVVGFFRIWTIPRGRRSGAKGRFEPEDEGVWGAHGRELLEMMLESSTMLPLAEDLGVVPDICRVTLMDLGICGLKVQRWEKRWRTDKSFIDPSEYPPLSVATLSTHDSEILSAWWEAFPSERDQLWPTLGGTGPAPNKLPREVQKKLVSRICKAPSLFAILLIQELLDPFDRLPGPASSHRINQPGTIKPTNWIWRCPVKVETLLADDWLASHIHAMVRRD